jgi:hypothetical protein
MSTLVVATLKSNSSSPPAFQNTSGTEIGTLCRAWVNFNGTGTVAIRAQFNVSSITDNGAGDYTVNFTNSLADANYSANGTVHFAGNNITVQPFTYATTSVRIYTMFYNGSLGDGSFVNVAIFR